MVAQGSSKDVVVVPMDRGYAIVPAADWSEIADNARLVDKIAACATWGEYRALGSHLFEGDITDEGQDDAEPFLTDLPFDGNYEYGFDRFAALEMSTSDFFDSLADPSSFNDWIDGVGNWKWVKLDFLENVVTALAGQGFVVTEANFD